MNKPKSLSVEGKNIDWWIEISKRVAQNPVLALHHLWYNTNRVVTDYCLYPFGLYNYRYRIIFLAGMALGGSTWIKNLLANVPGIFTRFTPMPYDVSYNQNICDSAFSHIPKFGNTLFKTHLNPTHNNLECLYRNGVEKILVSYRDLRDVIVSRHHRLINFPKDKNADDFVDYNVLGNEKAMDHSIEIIGEQYVPWIQGWMDLASKNPNNFHLVRFEDLKIDTKGTFKSILDYYEITLTDKKIDEIISRCKGKGSYKKNIDSSKVLPFGISSNFRAGRIGDWRNDMTENQILRCKELLGSTLIKLGYEKDMSWN